MRNKREKKKRKTYMNKKMFKEIFEHLIYTVFEFFKISLCKNSYLNYNILKLRE
jgi:hypothetical protein